MITILILLVAIAILGWGFVRARSFGKLGILAWLQSAVLMLPWLLFFSLFAAGIYLNLAGALLLIVVSASIYIFLGRQLRIAAQDPALAEKFAAMAAQKSAASQPVATQSPTESIETPDAPDGSSAIVSSSLTDAATIPAEDLQAMRSIFGVDTFFSTESIPYGNGMIFKGNLRGDAAIVRDRLAASLATSLGDRYRLFLVQDPTEKRPVVIILPSVDDPAPTSIAQWILAAGLAVATIATCLETAGLLQGFDFFGEPSRWRETTSIALGILTILAAHESAHRVLAQRHQVRLSPPFFIPTWQIGSFGAITRIQSWLKDRSVLFDIAFAGPAASGIVSVVMLLWGLLLSHQGSLFQLRSEYFQGSILVAALARIVLGDQLQQPFVGIHPLVMVGWLGLVVTAINLLPAGQLDGGRIVQAIYGRNVARVTTIATLIVLGLAALVNPLAIYWAIVILFLQRDLERPALNELTEPDDTRAALALLALFLMAATLLPLTPSLAGRLGIGG
ncbi:site-2 protease family protein [Microcoleus sp. FACHB-1515]|uniref:site-2 protease family protein n=1 Tax=Cyanophyceae TaxID=3028117 RepID=UPI00168666D1|nr:site-2 protease family protein [Microcoleus sp. FACHB-1515]MBD2092897.1 site-2 protease family protein [Microcoleus sp. FACHB-1515]